MKIQSYLSLQVPANNMKLTQESRVNFIHLSWHSEIFSKTQRNSPLFISHFFSNIGCLNLTNQVQGYTLAQCQLETKIIGKVHQTYTNV